MAIKTDLLNHNYRVVLVQLNESQLGELTEIKDLSYSPAFIDIGELTFNLPMNYLDESGVSRVTPLYKELDSDMLILIDETEYYYINTCIEVEAQGTIQKQVHAYRRQYELSMKSFNNYIPETERFLYFVHPADRPGNGYPWLTELPLENDLNTFITSSKDEYGEYYGIFNMVEKLTSWKLKKDEAGNPLIPDSIKKQTRMITTSETNILELMKMLQEAWGCIFYYDTVAREITILPSDLFLQQPNGVLSDENFITGLTRELRKEEVKTRLYMYNSKGTGVLAERMAHGQSYIENYDYFRNDKYMSTELQNALVVYFDTLDSLEFQTEGTWTALKALYAEKNQTLNKIEDWNTELIDPSTTYDHYMSVKNGFKLNEGLPNEEVVAEPRALLPQEQEAMDDALRQINALSSNIYAYTSGVLATHPRSLEQINVLIDEKMVELRALQSKSLMPDVFSDYELANSLEQGSLMKEIEPYVRDATHQSETIENVDELYSLGRELIKKVSKPRLQFSIEVMDFLSKTGLSEFKYLSSLGSIIRIENSKLDFADNVILLKYTHTPESNGLTLEFSNQLDLKDDTSFLAELIAKSNSVSSQVSFQSSGWGGGGGSGSGGSGDGNTISDKIQTKRLIATEIEALRIEADEIYAKIANIDLIIADSAVIKNLEADYVKTSYLEAKYISADQISANYITVAQLEAERILTEEIYAKIANIDTIIADSAVIKNLEADYVRTDYLVANYLTVDEIVANYITASQITADFADIGLANIETGLIATIIGNDLLYTDGHIQNLKVGNAEIVELNAAKITAGVLSVDRLLIRDIDNPEKSIIFGINSIEGGIQSTVGNTINGEVLTNRTIFAEKLIAKSITADEIATGTITAIEIMADTITAANIKTGTITAVSGVISDIDANVIKTGTLDASLVAVTNLNASNLKTGRIESFNGMVSIDMQSGYFNFGDALISDSTGVKIKVGDSSIQDYIAGEMDHRIEAFPTQSLVEVDGSGELVAPHTEKIFVNVYKGNERVGAIISNLYLTDAANSVISITGITYEVQSPTTSDSGSIKVTIPSGVSLPGKSGFIKFSVKTSSPAKTYFYQVGWSKVEAGTGFDEQIVVSLDEQYYLSESATSTTGGSWSDTPLAWETDRHIWVRNKITYSNPAAVTYSDPRALVSKTEIEDYKQEVSATFEATKEGYVIGFNDMKKYINFIDGNIIIGRGDSLITLKMQSDKMAFLVGGAEVATFTDKRFKIFDGEFENSLKLGNYSFKPRSNGNLSFGRN